MAYEFHTTRRVEFADTDMAGIIHFANYFCYMEQAEHDFLRSIGLTVFAEYDGDHVTWPRVHAQCDFVQPVRFEDVLDVRLSVARKGTKSLTYDIRFSKDGAEVARGTLVVACCRTHAGTLHGIPIPDFIASKIEQRPEQPITPEVGSIPKNR